MNELRPSSLSCIFRKMRSQASACALKLLLELLLVVRKRKSISLPAAYLLILGLPARFIYGKRIFTDQGYFGRMSRVEIVVATLFFLCSPATSVPSCTINGSAIDGSWPAARYGVGGVPVCTCRMGAKLIGKSCTCPNNI